jgi:hypothetical protein
VLFGTSIAIWETFHDFQDLITPLVNEEMKIVDISSNGRSQENIFYSNVNKGRHRHGKTSFEGRHGSLHGGHHQHEGQPHGSEKINFEGTESHVGRGENH